MRVYGIEPEFIEIADYKITELMHYLYLPVKIIDSSVIRIPDNLNCIKDMIYKIACNVEIDDYVYVTARHGWATPDNPLNRPGWHTDGFGTIDANYTWYDGAATRYAIQQFNDISENHIDSMKQRDVSRNDPARAMKDYYDK